MHITDLYDDSIYIVLLCLIPAILFGIAVTYLEIIYTSPLEVFVAWAITLTVLFIIFLWNKYFYKEKKTKGE